MLHCIRIRAGAVAGALLAVLPRPALAAETPKAGHEHAEEIVVTASPLDRAPDDLAMPVDSFDREHLLEHLGSSLGETLAREPGITTTGFAPGASNPVIRGQGSFRVRTLENGIGTHDVSMLSDDHGLPVNPLVENRVEVIRGPATLRYGGGAIAGAIDALSDRVPKQLRERLEGELYGSYGSVDEGRDDAFLLDGSAGGFAWHLDGMSRDSHDYELPGDPGEEFNSETDGYSIAAGGAWIGERGRLGLGVSRFTDEYGIPAPEDPLAPISIDLVADRYMLEGDLLEPFAGISEIRLRGAFTDYDHDELEAGTVVGSTFQNRQYEGRLEFLHAPIGSASGAFGAHVGKRDLDASGEGGELLAPSRTRSLALYGFEELPLSQRLTLQLGARAERTELEGIPIDDRPRDRRFYPLSASAGLVLDLSDATSLGLSATASQRAPDTLELFARGPHEASETFEIGDPSLDEERVWSLDLTLRTQQSRFESALSVFYMSYSNFTWGRFTGNLVDEDGNAGTPQATLDEVLFSQDDAWFAGAEAEAHFDLVEWAGATLGVDGALDLVRARVSGDDVPRIPPLRIGAGLYLSHPRARLRVGVRRVEEQDRLAAFETGTGAYTMFEASLALPLRDWLELRVTGTNLGDEVARNHISLKKEDVVLPGRDVRVALRATF
jgi:iron complex outermembrane receptor protein